MRDRERCRWADLAITVLATKAGQTIAQKQFSVTRKEHVSDRPLD